MDAESNPHETIVPIQLARETEALKEILQDKNDRLEARISTSRTRIARFPKSLRVIGGAEHRYVVPSVVAIGPYHHGRHHLQEMEEVKHAAAYRLLRAQSRTVEEVYEKVLSVAGDARRCYDDSVVAGLSDAEFARMMFVDGCFLLWYLHDRHEDPLISGCAFRTAPASSRTSCGWRTRFHCWCSRPLWTGPSWICQTGCLWTPSSTERRRRLLLLAAS
jgi:hypothetical protein